MQFGRDKIGDFQNSIFLIIFITLVSTQIKKIEKTRKQNNQNSYRETRNWSIKRPKKIFHCGVAKITMEREPQSIQQGSQRPDGYSGRETEIELEQDSDKVT